MKFTTPAIAALLTTAVSASPLPNTSPNPLHRRANTGEATFYGGNLNGGMCSFSSYTLPSGIYGTALSDANWETAGNCGACVKVTGPSGASITAMVVDQCPGCGTNHLDLFEDAFGALAEKSAGVIDVSWDVVECGIATPISLMNKEGTSAYWFSMQVVNANERVERLEVSTDGGATWQETTRTEYNFFENSSGFGADTVAVRVTGVSGKTVVTEDVQVSGGVTKEAASNF
ncbi:hypothetical protein SLS58_002866 [Diplodia intermedia]|uniref:Expansin-like EG45 domain-containing protein n=1 Tax=Diplodia intermedia TaxID=856260 RepID=A0ABR3TXU1_9PEZI